MLHRKLLWATRGANALMMPHVCSCDRGLGCRRWLQSGQLFTQVRIRPSATAFAHVVAHVVDAAGALLEEALEHSIRETLFDCRSALRKQSRNLLGLAQGQRPRQARIVRLTRNRAFPQGMDVEVGSGCIVCSAG